RPCRGAQQSTRPSGNCYRRHASLTADSFFRYCNAPLAWSVQCFAGDERTYMGPAIALRLRQHLTLTPQVQQALKLLQMSAMEFAQEMEQALAANPFLEENPDAPAQPLRDAATVDDVVVPQETTSSGPPVDRDQEDWGGAGESQPTLAQHLRDQLMISQMGERD